MSKKAALFFCLLMLLLWTGPLPSSLAQKQADGCLEGLKNVHVRVRLIMDSGAKGLDLRPDQLERDAEALLSAAGLKVVSQDEFQRLLPSRGYPVGTLDLDSKIFKPGEAPFYVFYLNIKVRQPAFMSRKPAIRFLAPTWETTELGAINTPSAVREMAQEAVKSFISDFKGENP